MGLRTWIYTTTGIKLKKFEEPISPEVLAAVALVEVETASKLPDGQMKLSVIADIEEYINSAGEIKIPVNNQFVALNLAFIHERRYAAQYLLNLKYPQGDIDTLLFKKFVQQGDRVLDAGANIGITALELLDCGASYVLAVEPIPEIYSRLSKLESSQIKTLHAAIGASVGKVNMFISLLHNQGSSYNPNMLDVFPAVFSEEPKQVEVNLTCIDEIQKNYAPFDVWKVDVEGAEIDLIKGASQVLKHTPPRAIIAEVFDPFLDKFIESVKPSHPFIYRAYIRRDNYTLELVSLGEAVDFEHHPTSPMYVFLTVPLHN